MERLPLPGGVCGVYSVHGEKEVKPVGLTVFRKETSEVSDFKVLLFCIISPSYLKDHWSWMDETTYRFFLWCLYVSSFFFLYPLLLIPFFFAHLLSVVKTRWSGWKGRQEDADMSKAVSYGRPQKVTEMVLLASSFLSLCGQGGRTIGVSGVAERLGESCCFPLEVEGKK